MPVTKTKVAKQKGLFKSQLPSLKRGLKWFMQVAVKETVIAIVKVLLGRWFL